MKAAQSFDRPHTFKRMFRHSVVDTTGWIGESSGTPNFFYTNVGGTPINNTFLPFGSYAAGDVTVIAGYLAFTPLDLPVSCLNLITKFKYYKFSKVELFFRPRTGPAAQSSTTTSVTPIFNVAREKVMSLMTETDPQYIGGAGYALAKSENDPSLIDFWMCNTGARHNLSQSSVQKHTLVPKPGVISTQSADSDNAMPTNANALVIPDAKGWQPMSYITNGTGSQTGVQQWIGLACRIEVPNPGEIIEVYAQYTIRLKGLEE